MKFYVIALAFVGLAAADVSHLKLGLSADGGYGLTALQSAPSSSSTSSEVVQGGDSSSYQYSKSAEVVPGSDASSYQPAEYTPAHLKSADVVPGGDSSSYQPAEYTPEHLKTADVVPGGDSSSYQPAEYTPAHLKALVPPTIGADTYAPVPAAIGADTYTPEKFIPQDVQEAHYKYIQEQEQGAVVPGGDSSSYQPAEYTPEHLKTAEVVPGGDSSSYQPAEYTPAHLKASVPATIGADTYAPVPAAIGADTYTPEKFIPQDVQEAHYKYIQEQEQGAVVPGGDSSSYQPAEYTPEHLKTAEVVPGGDSSSYQPAEYTPAHLKASVPATIGADTYAPVPAAIGADTYTPEKFIPQDVQEAHYKYIQEQEQGAVVPGGDSSSYQPAEYTPAQLKNSVVASTAASAVSGGDSSSYQSAVSQTSYVHSQAQTVVAGSSGSSYQSAQPIAAYVQGQAPVVIGANTITPAHLYEEPTSNGIEELNPDTQVPVAIGADTITPAHLQATYSKSSQETQYASNGGYIY
ncbi:protein transport protein SEC31 isoform X1 [Drosophila simulans]|uniref:protein transport protein SEC31 isoform X1 n=1 Tax=Drosophila simulans TaxID=7240 RepID=UPI00192D051C|nr:protein transport protein SEC31 isoform X1 [Drosophila simulans]